MSPTVIECSECGHLHFNESLKAYEPCPLINEGCECPNNDEVLEGTYLCPTCEERHDENETPWSWSEPQQAQICENCWSQSFDEASTAWLVEGEEVTKYLVTEHGTFDGEYLEEVSEPVLVRAYHRTDGWRGYFETKPQGDWREASSGWTTGNWGDAISDSKQAFNAWVERLLKGHGDLEHPVWVVADHTSNVFSTAVGVFVPSDVETLDVPSY